MLIVCVAVVLLASTGAALIPTAFTVAQSTHLAASNATVLPFDKIITWRHSRAHTGGLFLADKQGLYTFQVYSLTKTDAHVWLELYHNSQLVVSLRGRTPNDYADAGNAAILKLAVGDQVFVQSRDQFNVSMYGLSDNIYTTFSGVYIGDGTQQTGQSAFSVALDRPMNVTGNSTVLYNKVLLDVTNAFDVTSGVFTAPSAGVYVFHFFSMGFPNTEVWQELYHNDAYICSLYNFQTDENSGAGNTAILHLVSNDQVKVVTRHDVMNNLLGDADEIYTTFTGFQIPQTTDTTVNGSLVAFSAGLSRGYLVLRSSKMIFDTVFTNLLDGYDNTTGVFTAPVAGLYELNFHALGDSSQSIWLELFQNYRYIDSLYSHEGKNFATGGNAAVLNLDVGDVVYVAVRYGGDERFYGQDDQIYCTFSGYLIAKSPSALNIVGK